MTKAVVLLSGGQDSTTCLYWAKINFDEVHAVSIFYGQRHKAELSAAAEIAKAACVGHTVLEAPVLSALGGSALVDASKPLLASGGIADKAMPEGLPTSFVPGRNILFLTLASAFAVKEGAHDVVTGVCQTDYSGYPDCRHEFVRQLEIAIAHGMPTAALPLRLITPLMWMTKAETVHLAKRLPGCWESLALSITCYHGKRPGCGECAACSLRVQGFKDAGYEDPAG